MTSFNNDWILQLDFHNLHLNTYYVYVKEACNWGHGLSAAIKLGSLEKTVGTCLLRSGVYYEQSFSCRKNCTTQPFAFVGDSPFFLQKKTSIFFLEPNWFLDHLQAMHSITTFLSSGGVTRPNL